MPTERDERIEAGEISDLAALRLARRYAELVKDDLASLIGTHIARPLQVSQGRALSRLVQEARAEEREACAKIADDECRAWIAYPEGRQQPDTEAEHNGNTQHFSAAIRARREGEGEDG